MIARLALALERLLLRFAGLLARHRQRHVPQEQPRYVPHVLSDEEIERIAEQAFTTELYAPEILVWQERVAHEPACEVRRNFAAYDDLND